MNGIDLLAEFRKTRSETAFAGLVRHYTNLIYSVAWRRFADPSLAEETTQTVFIRLAKNPPTLQHEAQFLSWLHRTTVYVAIDLWRKDNRRRTREEQAFSMQTDSAADLTWQQLAPELDEALNRLSETDKQTLLLRFFHEKTMRDVGAQLGISEDAAKMRVNRALEKLRQQLGQRKVVCSAAVLSVLLGERSVQAAPAGLVAALLAIKIPAISLSATSGLIATFLNFSKIKIAASAVAILLTAIVATAWWKFSDHKASPSTAETSLGKAPLAVTNTVETTGSYLDPDGKPNARKLLQHAIAARQKITSGTMELKYSHPSDPGEEADLPPTKAYFFGGKFKFESIRRYRSTSGYDLFSKTELVKIKAKVAKGLLEETEDKSGYVETKKNAETSIFDGTVILTYDTGSHQGKIEQSASTRLFDPRSFGLNPFSNATPLEEIAERYLAAKFDRTVPEEKIDDLAAWHIHFEAAGEEMLDCWLEVSNPARVLKMSSRFSTWQEIVVSSQFSHPETNEILPDSVKIVFGPKNPREVHITRSATKLNIPLDPALWTMKGLNMPLGTSVVDYRSSRNLGYWAGSGLSDDWRVKYNKTNSSATMPDTASLLVAMEKDPASPSALTNALWLIHNTPDGPVVDRAGEIIIQEHLHATNLIALCQDLKRLRPHCAEKLLQAIFDYNPNLPTRASACYSLAMIAREDSQEGKETNALTTAEKLFTQLSNEFGELTGPDGQHYKSFAESYLTTMHHAAIGRPAPEIEGLDLDGNPMKLSDFRGKTVVLVFWGSGGCHPVNLKSTTENQHGQPLVILGVCEGVDLKEARHIVDQWSIPWPSFRADSARKYWNIESWPTACLVDAAGIIRAREVGVSNGELDQFVKKFMAK